MASKRVDNKVISAQCLECQSENKRGCGTPAQAQASARVDVRGSRSPTRVHVFARMLLKL